MTTRNINIPPPGRPGSLPAEAVIRLRLVDANGERVTPADVDNNVLLVGDGVHAITDQGYTLVLTTQDSIAGETYWIVEVPYGRDAPAVYRVQIPAGADMTWNEFTGAGAPVDPGDIWTARLWPADLAGNAGRWGKVNAGGTAIEYTDAPAGSGDVTGPSGATDGNLAVFDGPSGKVIKDGGPPGQGGASTFIDLTDTPADYTGQAGKVAAVNGTEDGIEFADQSSGNTDLSNTPSATEVTVESSTGQDTSLAAATQTLAGVLSAADKLALDNTDAAGTARPPTVHAATHATGQSDAIAPADIGADAAGTPRPPTAHATTHRTGQSDEITPSDIGAAPTVHTHTGDQVTITAGVQGNAVSIAVDGSLEDSGTPPGGIGGAVDSVTGQHSVEASPTTGAVVVNLVNDVASPGNNKVYGTDGAGLRGWKDDPADGGGSGDAVKWDVTQPGHGFIAVGECAYYNGTAWQKADSSVAAKIHIVVVTGISGDVLTLQQSGRATSFNGLTPGSYYYLQDDGSLGIDPGSIDAPVLQAQSATEVVVLPFRAGSTDPQGIPADAHFDGYTEQGYASSLPTSGTITVPLDGRIYSVTLTGAATIALGTPPVAPIVASTILYVQDDGNALNFPAGLYWAGGAEVAPGGAGTITRYIFATTPAGNSTADGEVLSVP